MSKHEGVIRRAALSVRRKLHALIAHLVICLETHRITDSGVGNEAETSRLLAILVPGNVLQLDINLDHRFNEMKNKKDNNFRNDVLAIHLRMYIYNTLNNITAYLFVMQYVLSFRFQLVFLTWLYRFLSVDN